MKRKDEIKKEMAYWIRKFTKPGNKEVRKFVVAIEGVYTDLEQFQKKQMFWNKNFCYLKCVLSSANFFNLSCKKEVNWKAYFSSFHIRILQFKTLVNCMMF